MEVLELERLDESGRAQLGALIARVSQAGDEPPLPEPERRAIAAGTAGGYAVVARVDDLALGAVFLFPTRDGATVLYLVVDPGERFGDLPSELLERALDLVPAGSDAHLWAMAAEAEDDARAARHGFRPERDLIQMRLHLPLDPAVVEATRPLVTRPFQPERDDETWIDTNNRAFAGHPEQGNWTVRQLEARLSAEWVDLDGFLVADDPDGSGLLGFCWTKIHADHRPVLGEIYIIGVDPSHHGQGWGRSLTVEGLVWLAGRGVPVGMLYVDATNASALALYRSLGFAVDHVDRAYRLEEA